MTKTEKKTIEKFLFIFMFLPTLLITYFQFSTDSYFLIDYGNYILDVGFPTNDVFSLHANLSQMIPQWLFAIFSAVFYRLFGLYGEVIFTQILYFILICIIYNICKTINDNKIMNYCFTLISELLFFIFIETRPQMVSYICILLIILILEKYIKGNNLKYLIPMPFIFILQINAHATMFPLLYMIIIAYIFDIKKFSNDQILSEDFKKMPIIVFMVISSATLLVNPYGMDSIIYFFKSMEYSSMLEVVSFEMQKSAIDNYGGQLILLTVILLLIIMFNYKAKVKLRHFLLLIGAYGISMVAIRNSFSLAIAIPIFLSFYLKDIDPIKIIEKIFGYWKISFILMIIGFGFLFISNIKYFKTPEFQYKYEIDHNPYNAINFLFENNDIKSAKVFNTNSAAEGAYLEFLGFKPYIDNRNEHFVINEENILEELVLLEYGRLDENEFIKKYDFDYLLLCIDDYLYYKSDNIEGYKLVYELDDNGYCVYKKIKG